ncbi:uncharacterized protein LOC142974626 [Anticarsia gemmatalis]|uniref:uncharacterized protein LOC142974626 n=1 Tax=Anticarsia gemmatalis TaxID=129554 RepID=UPI003F7618ED
MRRLMHKLVMDYLSLIIIFIVCIDQGDGHWKERERENLRHDIELYKKMAEKIEREIESFYDEYPDERYKPDNVDRIHYKHLTNILNRKKETGKDDPSDKKENKFLYRQSNNMTNDLPSKHGTNDEGFVKVTFKNTQPDKSDTFNSSWPKFEDILLAMGKKYDWKNDRWIKVKGKLKESSIKEKINSKGGDNNSIEFHEKHKFSYRIVKLNKSKSRRNVVVAVSAVR